MEQTYLAAGAARLAPDTPIPGTRAQTIGDFWAWAYSDVLSNRNRAIYAEFLVGAALGVTHTGVRSEWDAYDLNYEGKRIEIKSAGFVQSWKQESLSPIRFDVARKKPWLAATNEYLPDACRYSDCYVFCLMRATDDAFRQVLAVDCWEFYVVSTRTMDTTIGGTKSLSLSRLQSLCQPVGFDGLRSAVNDICQ